MTIYLQLNLMDSLEITFINVCSSVIERIRLAEI